MLLRNMFYEFRFIHLFLITFLFSLKHNYHTTHRLSIRSHKTFSLIAFPNKDTKKRNTMTMGEQDNVREKEKEKVCATVYVCVRVCVCACVRV